MDYTMKKEKEEGREDGEDVAGSEKGAGGRIVGLGHDRRFSHADFLGELKEKSMTFFSSVTHSKRDDEIEEGTRL